MEYMPVFIPWGVLYNQFASLHVLHKVYYSCKVERAMCVKR